jgi:hypothetical protein
MGDNEQAAWLLHLQNLMAWYAMQQYQIVSNTTNLGPRPPTAADAVRAAEAILRGKNDA